MGVKEFLSELFLLAITSFIIGIVFFIIGIFFFELFKNNVIKRNVSLIIIIILFLFTIFYKSIIKSVIIYYYEVNDGLSLKIYKEVSVKKSNNFNYKTNKKYEGLLIEKSYYSYTIRNFNNQNVNINKIQQTKLNEINENISDFYGNVKRKYKYFEFVDQHFDQYKDYDSYLKNETLSLETKEKKIGYKRIYLNKEKLEHLNIEKDKKARFLLKRKKENKLFHYVETIQLYDTFEKNLLVREQIQKIIILKDNSYSKIMYFISDVFLNKDKE